jgi:Cytochrome c3
VNKSAALSCKWHLLLVALFLVPFPFLLVAVAQAPTAPGSGHGYLIDKHIAAGLTCASCHRDAPPPKAPEMTACTGCHGSYSQIAAKTAFDQPNPHASHLGEIPCAACHPVHRASESLCDQCHTFGMKPP